MHCTENNKYFTEMTMMMMMMMITTMHFRNRTTKGLKKVDKCTKFVFNTIKKLIIKAIFRSKKSTIHLIQITGA